MRNVYLFPLLIQTVFCLKILIVNPAVGSSHVNFMCAIAEKLMLGGHEVHMVMNTVYSKLEGCGSINVHRMVHIPAREENVMNNVQFRQNPFKSGSLISRDMMRKMQKSIEQICDDVYFYYDDYLKPLESEKYDIGITQYMGAYPFLMMELIGVKHMVLASANPISPMLSELFGIPAPSSYVANPFTDVALTAPNFSFLERAQNFMTNMFYRVFIAKFFLDSQHTSLQRIRPDLRHPTEVVAEIALLLINTPVMLDHAKPTGSRVINIGGIAIKRDTEINEDVLAIIERAKKGVVLVSFGTIAMTNEIEGELLGSFLGAFKRFPDYEFLFKFDATERMKEELKNVPNVHLYKWLQQSAILAHPKTSAFISHMGLNSFMEASMLGVPIVAIPLFSDQPYNAGIAVQRGTGVYVDKRNIAEDILYSALNKVLNEESFKRNARTLKKQLERFPDNGTERMLKYIEYVGEFGRLPNLDLLGSRLDLITYYCLDVMALCAVLLFVIFYLIYKLIFCAFRRMFSKNVTKPKTE